MRKVLKTMVIAGWQTDKLHKKNIIDKQNQHQFCMSYRVQGCSISLRHIRSFFFFFFTDHCCYRAIHDVRYRTTKRSIYIINFIPKTRCIKNSHFMCFKSCRREIGSILSFSFFFFFNCDCPVSLQNTHESKTFVSVNYFPIRCQHHHHLQFSNIRYYERWTWRWLND